MLKIIFVAALAASSVLLACAPLRGRCIEYKIDQATGLACDGGEWEEMWWQRQWEAARQGGCHMEDSCGEFPPFYVGAEYCGPPETICPGERWEWRGAGRLHGRGSEDAVLWD